MSEQKGVWRTIMGRKVFIAEGQSLTEAMQASGKFSDEVVKAAGDNEKDEKKQQSETQSNGKKEGRKTQKVVNVNLDTEVQKQLAAAKTPKERQQIAFRYIMDNLRGKYQTSDGRTVAIERVGADKMTYQDNMAKLRVTPALAEMIKAGEYDHSAPGEEKANKKFEEFAYYKVRVKVGKEIYKGMLNVGIRKDGSSTLYDLRPFCKEKGQDE